MFKSGFLSSRDAAKNETFKTHFNSCPREIKSRRNEKIFIEIFREKFLNAVVGGGFYHS